MATTESRAGFRLPWSSDRAAAQSSELEETEPQAVDTAGAPDPQDPGEIDPPTNEASNKAGMATARPDRVEPNAPHAPDDRGSAGAPVVPPRARPTKFLAELTRAMQAAAELSRASTIASLQADANAFIEEIRGRSAGQVEFLRHNTDADIAGIREWSKAEIARIREESDARITIRRNRLDQHLERHAALVEDEVRKVQAQIASFEAEMERFFSELLTEVDPTEFAARAAQLPEAPTFTGIDEDALVALMNEPLAEDTAAPDEPLQVEDSSAVLAGDMPLADATEEASFEASGVLEAVPAQPADNATAEAEDAAAVAEAEIVVAETEIVVAEPEHGMAEPEPEAVAAEAKAEPQAERVAIEIVTGPDEQAEDAGAAVDETSEFDAAEAAAAEAAAAALQSMETMSGDFLAARLGGFDPATPAAPTEPDLPVALAAQGVPAAADAAPVVATQVIVSGLVSVASIAAFKRNLGGLPGVEGVGVSSGPDGEFVFNVRHADGVVVRDLVVSLPGFKVQVTGGGEGIVTANAHDPES